MKLNNVIKNMVRTSYPKFRPQVQAFLDCLYFKIDLKGLKISLRKLFVLN